MRKWGLTLVLAAACDGRSVPSTPPEEAMGVEIDEARARGVARQSAGDVCRRGHVSAQRREFGGRNMWRVECTRPVSRQSEEVHVIWIDAVSGVVDSERSDLRDTDQIAEGPVRVDEARAIELAKSKLGMRCLRSHWVVAAAERDGQLWWDVSCTASGDAGDHVASALVSASTGEVEVDHFQLEARSTRKRAVRPELGEERDQIDRGTAITIARRALGDSGLPCEAELQSFDSGRRWTVSCHLDQPVEGSSERTVWVDANSGDAELVTDLDGPSN